LTTPKLNWYLINLHEFPCKSLLEQKEADEGQEEKESQGQEAGIDRHW